MKTEKTKTYKILLDRDNVSLRLIKLNDYETLRQYNSENFSRVLADKTVFIDSNSNRVDSKYNPHIADKLIQFHCNNWKIDGLRACQVSSYPFRVDKRTDYIVDFENGKVTRKMSRNEKQCKYCGAIVDKSEIVGAFCEKCLVENDGLAYRYSYHSFAGDYEIQDKNVNQYKTAIFGAEIERDYLPAYSSNNNFYDDLNRALIASVKSIYGDKLKNKNVKRKAVFMRDSSLYQDGIEWITYPQSYKAYKQDKEVIDNTLKIMKKYNFGNTQSVGNHIHINRMFFGDTPENRDESKFAGALLALLFNEFWDEFKAISKRQDTKFTKKPIQTKKDGLFTIVSKTLSDEFEHSVAVNLQHRDTIEIRLWSGIDSADDLLLFLDLTQAVASCVKKKDLEACQRVSFKDILKLLTDKQEHLTEIKKRLNAKNITKHDSTIDSLLKELEV